MVMNSSSVKDWIYKEKKSPTKDNNIAVKKELLDGLTKPEKSISAKYFYDEKGSLLFEKIMDLDEYYPTRTELSLLESAKDDISKLTGTQKLLIEPGAGNCLKVQRLFSSMKPKCYMPIDISEDFIFQCAGELQLDYPEIDILPIAGDMQMNYPIPMEYQNLSKTIFYPGSTIGNYQPSQALDFLTHVASQLSENDALLIGVDLEKNPEVLHDAYNDKKGITALFNLNILNHVNTLLPADFNPSLFEHVAFYNQSEKRIEMHLESTSDHVVNLGDQQIEVQAGERIHTEYSYKYTLDSFEALAKKAGLKRVKAWVDGEKLFSLQYFTLSD
jgi:dimethylhistidine N-methyltransferase